ncbi:hypothetical protein SRABI83_03697 [Arthrobacter sp. Bi83]|nr:hypothetical protein SRABI83_03697 [Arthrobacter sp. Bi83]
MPRKHRPAGGTARLKWGKNAAQGTVPAIVAPKARCL